MNKLQQFLNSSKQFNILSNKMFNGCYRLDHFAFRSFNFSPLIDEYSKNNYTLENDKYQFNNNVLGRWLSHKLQPSLFISEFNLKNNVLNKNSSASFNLKHIKWLVNNREKPTYQLYQDILKENQYLAWTLLFENQINHVAFLVSDIHEAQRQIIMDYPEFKINNPKNPIQISEDKNLLQFSIKADLIDFEFKDGTFKVPYSFIEFVQRKNGRRGFESQNAAKIFESTNLD